MLVWGRFVPPFYEGFEAHIMICFNGNAFNSKCIIIFSDILGMYPTSVLKRAVVCVYIL